MFPYTLRHDPDTQSCRRNDPSLYKSEFALSYILIHSSTRRCEEGGRSPKVNDGGGPVGLRTKPGVLGQDICLLRVFPVKIKKVRGEGFRC